MIGCGLSHGLGRAEHTERGKRRRARKGGQVVTIWLQVKSYKDRRAGMRLHDFSSRRLVRPHCYTQTSENFLLVSVPTSLS
jgi:hypothetical protein